jgi:ribonuclease BN (tRNA processing enzyme)
VKARLLGSGGWIPTERRETACVFVRHGDRGLVLDAGTGLRRLVSTPELLTGVRELAIVLTHFHLDHVCGLAYVPALPLTPTIWAPGHWLYGQPSERLLAPLRSPPISSSEPSDLGGLRELRPGAQSIAGFRVRAREQRAHWAPTAGLRIGDELALITDTAYDPESAAFANDVTHLLHEAWSCSSKPVAEAGDATAAQAGQVAAAAGAHHLTLVHISPLLESEEELLADARAFAPGARLGEDRASLRLRRVRPSARRGPRPP